ncbi:probable 28S ribosomal protein S23, mitochondrial [Amphibalanus amphitrite]|uniref:probable 28S ribosomal protein S23, mitochondrial n=1 Tax=Amphibalanus amphitrite TaxID=1232801 RepID=UPI001C91B495|nr:probable 28S ribosomal protein S23, mitochondrial [Amphibalanus amphitrite]
MTVSGLIRSGSLNANDRPLWYDIYEAFPPRLEPRFDRPIKVKPVQPIFYQEDSVRARFQQEYGSPGTLQLRRSPAARPASICDQFVAQFEALRGVSPQLSEQELFEAAADALRASGVTLRRAGAGPEPRAASAEGETDPAPAAATAAASEKELLRVADLFDEQKPTEKR